MPKLIRFNARAQYTIIQGVNTLTNAVKVTIGPKGRNVVLDHPLEAPKVLNDGVAIARGIDLENPFTNMVVQLLKEAAIKTNDMVGDGTTTATILVQAILTAGLKSIAAGANPMILCKGIERACEMLVAEIEAISKPINTHEEIVEVGTIASSDPQIGELIAEVLDNVGRDGIIMIEEGRGLRTEIEYIKGMQLDRGYVSPYMATNQERMEVVFSNPHILVTDKKISNVAQLLPLLERLIAPGIKELFVIAEDIDGEALTTLLVNKNRGIFHILAIRAPSFGDRRDAVLEDIAIMTGAQFITEKTGRRLETATLADLGRASSVTTNQTSTVILDGAGDKDAIQTRMRELRAQYNGTTSDYDREKYQERLANFAGGVGVIKVGAATEIELKERKLRIEDALAAVRAANEEGIVPGGGVALVIAQPSLDSVYSVRAGLAPARALTPALASSHSLASSYASAPTHEPLPDEATGVNILRRALEEPLRQIAKNAGYEGSVVVANVRDKPFGYGFDALTGQYVDMFAAGIVDPTKVTRTALQNAVSIACMFLTTGTLITDKPEHIPDFKDIEFGL